MTYLITGGCGFVGTNLAVAILKQNGRVVLLDNLSRDGSRDNLAFLRTVGAVEFWHGDIRNANEVQDVLNSARFDAVFHLAGQVAMTTSLRDPRKDFEINTGGTINVLEAARKCRSEAAIVYASSNKVYGCLEKLPLVEEALRYSSPAAQEIDESFGLDFQTPYGCSKGAADQYMLDYHRWYGLNTVVFRHSTIYGGHQHATEDQGWIGWFCQQALLARDNSAASFTISGDGKQVRDLLNVQDAVACYLAAADGIERARGLAFNIGGGLQNSCSLLELFDALQKELSVELKWTRLPWRSGDQKYFVADNGKAASLLGWRPRVGKQDGIREVLRISAQPRNG